MCNRIATIGQILTKLHIGSYKLSQICLALATLSIVLLFSLFNSSTVIPLTKMIVLSFSSIVLCACNCGELLLDRDNRRSRRFLPHHALNLLNQIMQQPVVQPIP